MPGLGGGSHIGAIIERVKKGSIADLEGQLKPGNCPDPVRGVGGRCHPHPHAYAVAGDEVLEWNGRVLQGLTHQEVQDIIAESKQEPQVELMVCRPLAGSASGHHSGHPGAHPGGVAGSVAGPGPPHGARGRGMASAWRAPPVHKGAAWQPSLAGSRPRRPRRSRWPRWRGGA